MGRDAADPQPESRLVFTWDGRTFPIAATARGSGPDHALLLPALSSISTREEVAGLALGLAPRWATLAVDWPGFGTAPKPAVAWSPAALDRFIDTLIGALEPAPSLIVAAGHGAGYLLRHAVRTPVAGRRLVLVAPTWRGPLPTMLRRRPPALSRLARMADRPVIGQALYRLNVNPPMVRVMARAHVYADPLWLTPARAASKRAVTSAPGARHAAVRFVAGDLDPFQDRDGFLAAGAAVREPVLVLYGEGTPPKSKAEMQALAALPGMTSVVLPAGKLSLHEEFPDPVADAILRFRAG